MKATAEVDAMTREQARAMSYCPECGSRKGRRCRSRGEPVEEVHRARYEAAERPHAPTMTKKEFDRRRAEILSAAGAIWTRRLRASGKWITFYLASEAGIDVTDEKYALVCEEHGSILAVTSEQRAQQHVTTPDGWCPGCRGQP